MIKEEKIVTEMKGGGINMGVDIDEREIDVMDVDMDGRRTIKEGIMITITGERVGTAID